MKKTLMLIVFVLALTIVGFTLAVFVDTTACILFFLPASCDKKTFSATLAMKSIVALMQVLHNRKRKR
jgi:hypothetical protein